MTALGLLVKGLKCHYKIALVPPPCPPPPQLEHRSSHGVNSLGKSKPTENSRSPFPFIPGFNDETTKDIDPDILRAPPK